VHTCDKDTYKIFLACTLKRNSMKAIILKEAGGVENLIHTEIPLPVIDKGEVLVKVRSISINPVDVKTRANEWIVTWLFGEVRPVILGWDISGEIVAIGAEVNELTIGNEVFGMVNFLGNGKCYSEYVAVPASQLAIKPANITHQEAAAATLTALSAWQALVGKGKLKKGERVLIHAASGGVGHFAVQIAKLYGAYVIGTSSGANKDFVLFLGADEHIDYNRKEFNKVIKNVDFVLDTLGTAALFDSIDVVKDHGTIISLFSHELPKESITKASNRNIDLSFMMVQSNGDDMRSIARLLETGEIRAHVSGVFEFKDMDKAHLKVESGRVVGKIIVNI